MSWSWRRAVGSWALVQCVLVFVVLVSVGWSANSYLRDDPSVSSITGPGLRPLEVLAAITLVAPLLVGALAGLVGPRRRLLA